jgi:hypothetical protein
MSRKKTQNRTNIILERLSAFYHLINDEAIAAFYGVSESTVSSWRTRNAINSKLIKAKANDENLANWFINGIKPPDYEPHIVAESQAPYSPKVKVSDLLHKTAVILESDTVYRIALTNNIEAFHHAITCEEALGLANKRIDKLEGEMLEIKNRLPAVGE